MSYKTQPIGIVLVTAIASVLLAGTILAPTQASALSKFNTNTGTSNLKHGIRDGVNVNLEHRDQHINQENLCYRTNTCRQSEVGQNTLGNDNSVTGFTDQSDNLQQAAPSTANQSTANKTSPTPTPTPVTCGAGTVFDVTLQGNLTSILDPLSTPLPMGTVLCLQTAGNNTNVMAIPPTGPGVTVNVIDVAQPGPMGCGSVFVAASVTSGVLPPPLSGTTVCVLRF